MKSKIYEDTARRQKGRFFTIENPFNHPAFIAWAKQAGLPDATILEPFAGAGHIVRHLKDIDLCNDAVMFDIAPEAPDINVRDTLAMFPTQYDVCVTNPPWLGKNNSQRPEMRVGSQLNTRHKDLYRYALSLALTHCKWVAALIPGSFLVSNIFRERLMTYIEVLNRPFVEVDPPTGLALFAPGEIRDKDIWRGETRLGLIGELEAAYPVVPVGAPPVGPLHPIDATDRDRARLSGYRFGHDPDKPCFFSRFEEGKGVRMFFNTDAAIDTDACNQHLDIVIQDSKDILRYPTQGRLPEGHHRRYMPNHLATAIARCHATSGQINLLD